MAEQDIPVQSIAFDDVEIDVAGYRLRVDGRDVPLERKAFAVLVLLAGSPGRMFTRDEILDAVWQHRHVTPGVLNRIIALLRQALGDSGETHRYLHTVHGVGYRLDATLREGVPPSSAAARVLPVDAPELRAPAAGPSAPAAPRRLSIWLAAALLAVAAGLLWWQRSGSPPAAHVARPVLVVLPLRAVGPGNDDVALADGLSEELITRLARIEGLRLIARMSASIAGSEKLDLDQLVARLGVTHVLEGSLRQAGDQLRVDLRLVAVPGGHALWAQAYDRRVANVLALEDDIAQAVASALTLRLGLAVGANELDPALYVDYLRARQRYRLGDRDGAVTDLESLIARSPDFAPAHATLARVLATNLRYFATPQAELETARREAERAQALDPSLAETQTTLAILACRAAQWARCDELFRRSLSLDPSDTDARGLYASWLAGLGYLEAAKAEADAAWKFDPLSRNANFVRGRLLDTLGRHDEAEPILAEFGTSYVRWFNAVWRGDLGAARAVALEMPLDEGYRDAYVAAGEALADPAQWPRAMSLIEASESENRLNFLRILTPAPDYPRLIAGLGQMLRDGWPSFYMLLWMPEYSALRRDPAFEQLLRSSGIIDYWNVRGWPPGCRPHGAHAVCP